MPKMFTEMVKQKNGAMAEVTIRLENTMALNMECLITKIDGARQESPLPGKEIEDNYFG